MLEQPDRNDDGRLTDTTSDVIADAPPADLSDGADGASTPLPVPVSEVAPSSELVALVDDAEEFRQRARAASTRRAYASDWADFTVWCGRHGAQPLPVDPRVVALYLSDRAKTKRTTTLQRRLSAIQHYHVEAGHRLDTPPLWPFLAGS